MRFPSGSHCGNNQGQGKNRSFRAGGGNRRFNGPIFLLRLVAEKFLLAKELLLAPATPWHVKLLMVGTVLYLLSPMDLIPDMIPILGITDDLAILVISWSYCERFTTEAMWQQVDSTLQRWD